MFTVKNLLTRGAGITYVITILSIMFRTIIPELHWHFEKNLEQNLDIKQKNQYTLIKQSPY